MSFSFTVNGHGPSNEDVQAAAERAARTLMAAAGEAGSVNLSGYANDGVGQLNFSTPEPEPEPEFAGHASEPAPEFAAPPSEPPAASAPAEPSAPAQPVGPPASPDQPDLPTPGYSTDPIDQLAGIGKPEAAPDPNAPPSEPPPASEDAAER